MGAGVAGPWTRWRMQHEVQGLETLFQEEEIAIPKRRLCDASIAGRLGLKPTMGGHVNWTTSEYANSVKQRTTRTRRHGPQATSTARKPLKSLKTIGGVTRRRQHRQSRAGILQSRFYVCRYNYVFVSMCMYLYADMYVFGYVSIQICMYSDGCPYGYIYSMIYSAFTPSAAVEPLFARNGRVYENRGIWHNSPSLRQISNKMKKISYELHRNLLVSQIVKNLLWKRSRFCKDIL